MSVIRCKFCKTYVDKEDSLKLGVSSFCSEEHLQTWSLEQQNKTRSRLRQRALDRDIPHALRQRTLEADGHQCRFCGTPFVLHLHHIRYRSEGGGHEPSNLITLCWEHHEVVHSDKKLYQPLCRAIVWKREIEGDKTSLIGDLI